MLYNPDYCIKYTHCKVADFRQLHSLLIFHPIHNVFIPKYLLWRSWILYQFFLFMCWRFNFFRDFDERIKVVVFLLIYKFILLLTPKISRRNTSFTRWWKLEVNWWYVCVCGSSSVRNGASFIIHSHRLNMELDLQSLFGLHVHSCTCTYLQPIGNHLLPHLGSYTRALLVSQDRRHLFVTSLFTAQMKYTDYRFNSFCTPLVNGFYKQSFNCHNFLVAKNWEYLARLYGKVTEYW